MTLELVFTGLLAAAAGLALGWTFGPPRRSASASPPIAPETPAASDHPDSSAAARERAAVLESEIDSLIYSISHDVRAPLRSISGFSKALLEDCGAQLDDAGRGYLDRVCANTQKINDYMESLLALSRLGRAELRVRPVNVSEIVTHLGEQIAAADPARPVAWTVQPDVHARADPALLSECLRALLDNAWKFTAGRNPATIAFSTREAGPGGAVYSLSDNGAGFDMAYAGKLFGAFQRLHPPDQFPGEGVGLARARRIVHRHGGRIWAEATPDAGATFSFTLAPETSTATAARDTL